MGSRPFKIFFKAGHPEDANWSYGDGCGPHGILKYVRSVQIVSSGAMEPAAVPLECLQRRMLGGPEDAKWSCEAGSGTKSTWKLVGGPEDAGRTYIETEAGPTLLLEDAGRCWRSRSELH